MHVIAELAYLNLLCILFSLPIITLFPSLFALTKTVNGSFTKKEAQNQSVFRVFKGHFLDSIKTSFKFALIIIPVTAIIWLDFSILSVISSPIAVMFRYALFTLSALLFVTANYALFLYAERNFTLKHSWMAALILMVKNPLHSLLLAGANLLFILAFLFQTGLAVLFIFSVPTYILIKIVNRTSFRRI